MIQLKRFQTRKSSSSRGYNSFSYGYESQQEKVEDFVQYPIKGLDIRQFVQANREIAESPVPILYDLYAVSNHFGSLNGGHYTASALNSLDEKWYDFNDSSVSPIRDPEDVVNRAGYVLFYRRRDQ